MADPLPGLPLSQGARSGWQAVLGGIRFVLTTPSVWPFALVPLTVLIFLFCGLSGLGFWGAREAVHVLLGDDLETWGKVGYWTLTVLLWLISILLAGLLALVLAQPLSGFALEHIASRQEWTLTGKVPVPPSLLRGLWIGLRVALVTVVVGGVILGSLFAIDLIFPPAAVVTVPLKFLISAWLLAWDLVDYPLSLHGQGLRQRLRWAGRHFRAFTIFGLVWATLLLVPGIFFLVLPLGVAGATRLVVASGVFAVPSTS